MIFSLFLTRFIPLCCSILMLCYSLEGQDRRFGAGAMIGINASQIQGDTYAGYNKLGFTGGLTAQVRFTNKSDLGLELLYSQLGSRSTPNQNNTTVPFKFILHYVSIPVYYSYKDWLVEEEAYYKLHFYGGLSYGRLFNSKVDGDPVFDDLQDFFKKNYLGILFGATYYMNRNLGIGARWERGLLLLYINGDAPNQPNHRSLWDKHLTFFATYSL